MWSDDYDCHIAAEYTFKRQEDSVLITLAQKVEKELTTFICKILSQSETYSGKCRCNLRGKNVNVKCFNSCKKATLGKALVTYCWSFIPAIIFRLMSGTLI